MIFAGIADWAEQKAYPVEFMCAQLGVSVSGYYAWRNRGVSARERTDELLKGLIEQIYQRLAGNPGTRRVHAELASMGHRVGRKRVWRLMSELGLQGRHPRAWRKTTTRGQNPLFAPDLVKGDFTATAADRCWVGDITYIKTWTGWVYLATVIDLYSRKVVGWALADHMRTELVTDALAMALQMRRPKHQVIFHSDRGTQYTSGDFVKFCRDNKIRRSMGRTGVCWDNAVAESFFASYKKELIHTRPWPTLSSVRKATFEWIEMYYNRTRRHSSLGYLTPHEYELGYRHINELAA